MKAIHRIAALAFAAAFSVAALPVAAQSPYESIRAFDVSAEVRRDGSVMVTESITYDFGDAQRRGIYRDIPVEYETSYGDQSLRLKDFRVSDERGGAYPFETSKEGRYLRVKIGDPDAYVSGVHTYVIRYRAERALGFFDDFDEFYWNATGNEWGIPIAAANASVALPARVGPGEARAACFVGPFGSKEACELKVSDDGSGATFASPRALGPGEGLTVAIGFPKGLVEAPTASDKALDFLRDNAIALLPFAALAFMFDRWRKYGKDPKGRGTIVPEYDAPDGLSPIEVAALARQGVVGRDVSSEIVHLAERGWLSVERKETVRDFLPDTVDYVFTKKEGAGTLSDFDKKILDGMFAKSGEDRNEVKLSELKNQFHRNMPAIKKSVMRSVIDKGYFDQDPDLVKGKYLAFAAVFFIAVWALGGTGFLNAVWVVSLIASGFIVAAFGFAMPRATEKGARAKEAILGLKDYLQIAEKDRLAFHNAPEKSPKLFERLLPFAMALNVDEAWAKEFAGMHLPPPSWYSGPSGMHFNSVAFAGDMRSFSSAVATNMASAPGSSSGSGGGGSSGGGGGGGGGGSW